MSLAGSKTRIRQAVPDDAEGIARVHVETWRATYAGLVPERYLIDMTQQGQARAWRREITCRGAKASVLVAEAATPAGAALVGFGSCGTHRGGTLPFKGEIFTLYVAGDWQNQGIGGGLLGALFQSLQRVGLSDAFLWVLAGNPSRFFYEAMGGQSVAERQERFAGKLLDETAYAWPDLSAWLSGPKPA